MTENELDCAVRQLAALLGIRCYSVRNSRAGIATSRGYPDLTLVGTGGIAFRELKTEKGELRAEQVQWAAAIAAAGSNFGIWRPSDLVSGVILAELQQLATTNGRTKR